MSHQLLLFFLSSLICFSHLAGANHANFTVSEWITCGDYAQFQCRNATVPLCYEQACWDGIHNSSWPLETLNLLERRLVSGSPKKHLWLLQGGFVQSPRQKTFTDFEQPWRQLRCHSFDSGPKIR
jgi:hypothetical protein